MTLYGILLANNWTEPGASCELTLPSDLTRSFSLTPALSQRQSNTVCADMASKPARKVSNAQVYRPSLLPRRENRSVQSAPFIFQLLA